MFNRAGWMKSLALVGQLGITIIVPALLGIWLGQKTGSQYVSVSGLLLGLAAGIYSVYRMVRGLW